MRRALRLLAASAPLAFVLAASSPARADVVSGGVGLIGGIGGNFLDKPSDKSYQYNGATLDNPTSYPGFGGVNYGYGLALDVRVIGIVGLEIDFLRQHDRGHADWDFGPTNGPKTSYKIEIGQDAWHIPVLLKGVLPLPLFSPMVFLGFDFVKPSDGSASITPEPGPFTATAHADSYTMLMGGIGFEVKPPIPGIDLRIPFQLRAAHNGGTSDHLMDRQKLSANSNLVLTSVEYNSAWQWQAMATLGVQVFF